MGLRSFYEYKPDLNQNEIPRHLSRCNFVTVIFDCNAVEFSLSVCANRVMFIQVGMIVALKHFILLTKEHINEAVHIMIFPDKLKQNFYNSIFVRFK